MVKQVLFLLLAAVVCHTRGAQVVINEIMYHPPDDRDTLQFVELFNPGTVEVDLSGWKLSEGVKYVFPQKTKLPAGAFIVVAADAAAFQRAYNSPTPVLGNFTGKLSHKGEKLQLMDASGAIVEKLHFHDSAPWPVGPDGYGSSLERVSASGSPEDPLNWASSQAAAALRPVGSPGEPNSVASTQPLPTVRDVRWSKILQTNQPLDISAEIGSKTNIDKVVLQYRTVRSGRTSAPTELPMRKVSGTNAAARYSAQIPAQTAGALIRFTIQASDTAGSTRTEPGVNEPRPAFSAYVNDKVERAKIPLIAVVNSEALPRGVGNKFGPARKNSSNRGRSALVFTPPQGEVQLFDFVQVRRRAGGLKIHCFRDEPLEEMTAFNLIFEGPQRWVLSEHLSYELYRKAGLNIEKSGHARLTMDGRNLGLYLLVEQPNKHFLARSGRNDTGNLYKVLWFGQGVVDQHEKKTNPGTGHDDIVALVENLRKKSGAAQWAYINEQINVDAFANYYAVNMCIQNWDGFFNNHFLYHDLKPGGKWEVIPWDEDKTWGEYDGGPHDYSWYDMPLTIGSSTDKGQRNSGWFGGGGGPFGGGAGWWRPAGAVSGPLLANPQFRQRFEARLRELCNTVFTPEKFGPVISDLQQKLRPEIEIKARATGQDPASALRQFDADIASFQRQLVNRRKFILGALPK